MWTLFNFNCLCIESRARMQLLWAMICQLPFSAPDCQEEIEKISTASIDSSARQKLEHSRSGSPEIVMFVSAQIDYSLFFIGQTVLRVQKVYNLEMTDFLVLTEFGVQLNIPVLTQHCIRAL